MIALKDVEALLEEAAKERATKRAK